MTRIDRQTQRRISKSVLWTERQSRGDSANPSYASAPGRLPLRYAMANADIEHNAKGTAKLATVNMQPSAPAFTAGTTDVLVVNPIQKVWNGALLMLGWMSFEAANSSEDNDRWVIMQAWSATRIRGITQGPDIAPGGTGTLGTITAINGTFNDPTASVFLPTAHVTVKTGNVAWAELRWNATTNTSRWEIYSADCPEAG